MNNLAKLIAIFLFGLTVTMRSAGQERHHPGDNTQVFTGDKSSWHGYDRYDFIMDEETLTITPIKSLPDEGDGVKAPAKGQRRCIVVVPKEAAPGKPWSWQGCYWNHEPQTEVELLRRGFFIAFITPDPGKQWDAWYDFLTEKHGLSAKPAFVGMSKGGVNEYMWATAHPDKVSCIYADNPALWPESFIKLEELAKNDVPLLHVCGSYDFLLEHHTLAVENIYHQLGGRISTVIKEGPAHHPHSIRDPKMIADWIVENIRRDSSAPPSLNGITFVKSYYYPYTNTYSYLKEEDTYATCRGPLVADCYTRYDEMTNSTWRITGMTILVPKNPAPGKPWVFRANRIGREATAVDLALLAKGFYIVATPVTSQAGSVREQWDTIYMRLTANGFSAKPAMEGEGTGVGEAYSWAIHNPEKVSCIYGENPVMRSLMSKGMIVDSLAPLARAGVSLLHVCGSLDPWLSSNTRVAEKKYKELGGRINVIIHEGEGHYPMGPVDPRPVVDFIMAGMKAAAANRATGPVLHGGPPLPPDPAISADDAVNLPHSLFTGRDYHFDKTISREVLENYLSRAISMEGLLNGRGDLDDNIRMLRTTGAKFIGRSICLWGGEANLLNNFERARQQVPKVHATDPDMILEACIFEIVTSQVEQVPIPDWAFTALGLPVEKRNFRYEDMLYADGRRKDQWGKGASVPDVSRIETRLWFYFLAASYIDLGFEAIHYGQVELMNGNDKDLAIWAQVFSLARSYAAIHARRHMILCDAHTPGGGFLRDGKLLLDFHAFPLRIMEVPDKPQEAILKLGFSDGLYNRSKGGVTYSGWSCEHLPYLVELDNYGVSNGPGQPGQSKGGFDWIWGYDEITWFAHQTREYRSNWLRYAQDWVQKTDPNGHLEMPGSRTERSPLDKRRWYYANNASSAVPDGLGDEEAIRAIWEEDAKGPGQHVKEGRTAWTADQLRAGTAKVNITPEGDEPLHDSVYARSLVLELNGRRLAFISVDLAVFTSDRVEQICKEKYGIAGVMLCSSHNHSEPQKKGRSFEKGNPYTIFYEDQIIKAVGIAAGNMFPARIAAGHRSFPPLGFNRLIPREDGHARESWFGDEHYYSENPDRIPFEPVDPEVGVIKIENMQGQPRVILMNYACHADIVCFNYAISADYPGVACRKVEEAFGNTLNCLFVQGAGGNIESLMISSRRTGPDDPFKTDYAPMERMGGLLAYETIKLAKTLRPATDEQADMRIMDDSLQFSGRFDKTVHYNVHISTILINKDIVIAACPGELFVQLQLDWKKKMEAVAAHAFLFGYTWSGGKWPGYVADIRSAALGGYGADQDTRIIEVGAGEMIVNRQLENYYRLNGLMRDKPGPVGFKAGPRWILTPVPR